jgi:hypothetical protein
MTHYADDPFVRRRPVEALIGDALVHAQVELDAGPIGGVTDFLIRMAGIGIEMRRRLVAGPGDPWLDSEVAHLVTEDPGSNPTELIELLADDGSSPLLPPIRYAMAIVLARELADELPGSVRRLLEVRGCLAGRSLAEEARPYVAEAVRAFTLGLFVGTVALARAGFEHAAQDWLVQNGGLTRSQARRLSATKALHKLREHTAIDQDRTRNAQKLIGRGNGVMHRGAGAEVSEEDALASLRELAAVLQHLLPSG